MPFSNPSARFCPDGKRIVSVALQIGTQPVKVWDADSGDLLQMFQLARINTDAVFSPDGTKLAVGTMDGQLLIWDVESGELLSEYPGESLPILSLSYGIDGEQIYTSTSDGKINVWDASTGIKLYTLADFQGGVPDVMVSPDGKHLIATNQDGFTRFFLLDLDELIALAQNRVTRNFTKEECRQYLHVEECPEQP